ncbi:cupin domain-containing protein [Limosilactobacillus gastricus]|nr:carboxymuconolactone decarboxylase family protein [Limosilactobacillus gastricus]QGF39742.1 cupin domain-containing protein [Limosilactobacillus gastricus]
MAKIVQTAGRDRLGDFAPEFAHFNDDVLFGENWNNQDIDLKTRSIIVISVFMGRGLVDDSLKFHLQTAKKNGVTKREIAAIITHAAFYAGWPVAWAVFNLAKDVWDEDEASTSDQARDAYQKSLFFPIGNPNDAYAKYFVGQSYLASVCEDPFPIHNVTFEPGCRNNWHIHHADKGGGQALICVGGRGWYQEWGKDPVEMTPGTVIEIPAGVKHWHGAAADSWFSHLAFGIPGENPSNEWLEAVSDEQYQQLEK